MTFHYLSIVIFADATSYLLYPDNELIKTMRYLLLLLLVVNVSTAEGDQSAESIAIMEDHVLETQILKADSVLFDEGFNSCDVEKWRGMLADDLEFYDDRSGLNTEISNEVRSFKNNCSEGVRITRKLLESQVHRLNNFGAVQIGRHEFYEHGKRGGDADFIHIWELTAEGWKVKRAISYNH